MNNIVLNDNEIAAYEWIRVCEIAELEPLWGEAFLYGSYQIAIFLLSENQVYAVSQKDPATGAYVMSRAIIGSLHDRITLVDPLHKEVYDIHTGECYTKPDLSLPTWKTRVRDNQLEILLPPSRVFLR